MLKISTLIFLFLAVSVRNTKQNFEELYSDLIDLNTEALNANSTKSVSHIKEGFASARVALKEQIGKINESDRKSAEKLSTTKRIIAEHREMLKKQYNEAKASLVIIQTHADELRQGVKVNQQVISSLKNKLNEATVNYGDKVSLANNKISAINSLVEIIDEMLNKNEEVNLEISSQFYLNLANLKGDIIRESDSSLTTIINIIQQLAKSEKLGNKQNFGTIRGMLEELRLEAEQFITDERMLLDKSRKLIGDGLDAVLTFQSELIEALSDAEESIKKREASLIKTADNIENLEGEHKLMEIFEGQIVGMFSKLHETVDWLKIKLELSNELLDLMEDN